jgi:hypothetical protein
VKGCSSRDLNLMATLRADEPVAGFAIPASATGALGTFKSIFTSPSLLPDVSQAGFFRVEPLRKSSDSFREIRVNHLLVEYTRFRFLLGRT